MTNKNGQQLFTDIKTEDEGIEFYASAQHPKLNLSMRNLGDAVTAKLAKAFTEVFAVSSGATPRIRTAGSFSARSGCIRCLLSFFLLA